MFGRHIFLVFSTFFILVYPDDKNANFKLEGYMAYTRLMEELSTTVKTRSHEAVTYMLKFSWNVTDDITGLLSYTTPDVLLFFELIYSVVKDNLLLSDLLFEAAEPFERDRKRKNFNKPRLAMHKQWLENNFNFPPAEIYNFTKIITERTINDINNIPHIISDQIHLLEQKYKIIEQSFDNGDVNIINWFLRTGYPVDNLSLKFFENAFNRGHLNIVEFLLKYKFLEKINITTNLVNKAYFQDQTLLHAASYGSCIEALDFLIDRGANVNAKDSLGRTPLYRAVEAGNATVIESLVRRGANLSVVYGEDGDSLLHLAASINNINSIKALHNLRLSVNIINRLGETPLHSTVKYKGNVDTVRQLLQLGAESDRKNSDGEIPLIYAVRKKSIEIIKVFVQTNHLILTHKTANGDNALHIAADIGDTELADVLLKLGLDANLKNYKNHTPLYRAAIRGNQDVVDMLVPKTDLMSLNNGFTMLHEAVLDGNINAARILLRHGMDTNVKGLWENTPLHLAARQGFVNLVDLFLSNNARIDALNKNRMTALHYAALGGHYEVVKRLIEACSSLTIKNKSGKTAIDLAKVNNREVSYFFTPRSCPT